MEQKGYALITGASSGIGKSFAYNLAKRGYSLILVARREERLLELEKELPTECKIMICDLGQESECRRLMKEVQELPIEILINNAGFGDCGTFLDGNLQKELNMIDVNIKALHFLTKSMLLKMQETKKGYILNVASSAGLLPGGPYMATYYATKSYVVSLTQAIAAELKENYENIYVGCLCPGPVDTEFNHIANVKFALKGISPKYCADYGVKKMFQRKTIIIPTFGMKFVLFFAKILPRKMYIKMVGMQQKKKIYGA